MTQKYHLFFEMLFALLQCNDKLKNNFEGYLKFQIPIIIIILIIDFELGTYKYFMFTSRSKRKYL